MRKKLNLILVLFITCSVMKAQLPFSDSTYFILTDGTHDKYYYQRDVAVFRLAGGAQFTGTLPAFVTSVEWLNNEWHGYNRITFDTAAPGAACQAYAAYLAGYPGFEYGFVPVTRHKLAAADKKLWSMGSDLIAIRFRDRTIDDGALAAFLTRNELTLFHRPDAALPDADTWTWIFQLSKKNALLQLPACAHIFTNENGYVTMCYPDIQDAKSDGLLDGKPEYDCENLPTEFAAWGNSAYPDALWHIKNTGNAINPSLGPGATPKAGIAGADAKICDCWSQGYDGTGVKVAVIDNGGTWDYTFPNDVNQFLPGYDFNTLTTFTTSFAQNISPHGMRVASAIVGLPNTGQTTQLNNTTGVGVAYGAKVLPYICDLGPIQTPKAIQKAVLDDASVINMSWGVFNTSFPQSPIYNEINHAAAVGRNGLGIVFVASTGNDNADVVKWPAIMKNVIGVGASDPSDYRGSKSSPGGPWEWAGIYPGGGSTYHDVNAADTLHYDVVAPGTMIFTDEFDVMLTTPQIQVQQSGTSFAAPIVAGMAAIFLQKYPNVDANTVINSIIQNTDKVRDGFTVGQPMLYNYHQHASLLNGYNDEMFYGRVNCGKMLSMPVLGVKETNKKFEGIKLAYMSENEAMLLLDVTTNNSGFVLAVFDVSGRQISTQPIAAGKSQYSFNTENLKNGVYLFKVTANKNNLVSTFKYIK